MKTRVNKFRTLFAQISIQIIFITKLQYKKSVNLKNNACLNYNVRIQNWQS